MTVAIREGSATAFLVSLQRAVAAARGKAGTEAFHTCRGALEAALAEHGQAAVRADLDDEEIRWNDLPVNSNKSRRALAALLTLFGSRGIAELRFARALTDAEMATLCQIIHKSGVGLEPVAACRKIVEGLWDTKLRGTVDVISLEQTGHASARAIRVAPAVVPRLVYARLLALYSEYLSRTGEDELRRHTAWRLTKGIQSLANLAATRDRELMALAQVRGADAYPVNHAVNTCVLAVLMGQALQLPKPLLTQLGFSALLSWSGKLRTDPAVVNKAPSARTPEQQKEYARHPFRALATLLDFHRFEEPLLLAALVAFQFDARKGIPVLRTPLKEVNPLAQVVALCEAFDAVSSSRPPHEALDFVLTERAHAFDPTLVQVFTALVGRMIAR